MLYKIRIVILIATLLLNLFVLKSYATQDIIVDFDGTMDDFVALSLMACDPNYKINTVNLTPADSYKEPGVNIYVYDFAGRNLFPESWRE